MFYFFWQAEATCYFLLYSRISHIKNVLKFKVSSGQNYCYLLPIRNIGCCGFYNNCELATAAVPPQSFFVLLYDVCIGLPKSVILRHMNIPKSPCYRDKESVRIHVNISWKSARICKQPYTLTSLHNRGYSEFKNVFKNTSTVKRKDEC